MKQLVFLMICMVLFTTRMVAQIPVQVIDSATKQPLSFATVECLEDSWGTYTDSVGRATIPAQVLGKRTTFSYVGYTSKTLEIEKNTMEIPLQANAKKLDDVLIAGCTSYSIKEVGIRDKKSNFFFVYGSASGGLMWGTVVKNSSGKPSKIESVEYGATKLWKGANPNAPVRLRIFELDTLRRFPGEEITNELIEIIPGSFGWKSFDLKKYHMVLPTQGVIVAFEMIDAGPQFSFLYTHKMTDGTRQTKEYYGWQLLGAQGKGVVGLTKFPGKEWLAPKRFDGNGNAPQVLLQVKECD